MRIQFKESELEHLPESLVEQLDDDHVFDGDPTGIVEDVAGLKSALEREKENRRNLAKQIEEKSATSRKIADADIVTNIANLGGNVKMLPASVRERLTWSDEHGQYIVPAEDGQPIRKDDGSLKNFVDVIKELKADEHFAGAFAASPQSGGGSDPGAGTKPGDAGRALNQDTPDGLPPKTASRRTMTREQKVAIINAGHDLEEWPL